MFKYGDGYKLQMVQKNLHTAKENTVNIEFSAQGIDSGFFQMLFVLFLNFFLRLHLLLFYAYEHFA